MENKRKISESFLNWSPDKTSKEPIYKQIVDFFSRKISSGDFPIGMEIPSQRELAKLWHINRSTLANAIDELSSFGILEGVVGSGTRVKSNTWSLFLADTMENWGNYIQSGVFKENNPTIQTINTLEYDEKYLRIGTGELSKELFPRKFMEKIMLSAVEEIDGLNYLEALGLYELRLSLTKRLEKKNIFVKPENILITSGSLQALHLISICMMKPASRVFTEAPSYLKSLQVFQSAGIKLKGLELDKEGIKYWNIDTKDFLEAPPVIYTIPTNQNPTGNIMSQRRREEVYKFAIENRIPLIEDDAYGDLLFDELDIKPIKALDDNGLVLYMSTISKTLAPGLRIGWLVGPESVIARLGDVKMQIDYGSSSLPQIVLSKILNSREYDIYLEDLRLRLKVRRDKMLGYLDKYFKDLGNWDIPQGGFYIWLRLNKEIPIEKLFYKAAGKNILLNPGYVYDYKKNNAIRLSYSYIDEEDMEGAIRTLATLIEEYYN